MHAVYFAGPDVFRPDYSNICREIRETCRAVGISPLLPGDKKFDSAEDIFRHNLSLIRQAAAVAANLNPFRSPVEPDSGTVFECAYALALGKPVFGYLAETGDLKSRLAAKGLAPDSQGLCPGGWLVEDFGLPLNLMLAGGLTYLGPGLTEAIRAAAAFLAEKSP